MGLRFRKSFKILPGVKINFNKNSTSITFGDKGVHYTVNSKGKRTGTFGSLAPEFTIQHLHPRAEKLNLIRQHLQSHLQFHIKLFFMDS